MAMSNDSKIRDTAEAVKGIVESVPIYQDALQPAAKEIGTALQTVAKTIHIVLAPVSVLVWGYDQIKDFVSNRVAEKLKDVPPENIATPKPNVAGPALESLRYTGHEETLREMYANLLAASMDTRTANGAHPAFVEIIRQLTPDEARILRLLTQPRPFPLLTIRKEYKISTETQSGGVEALINFSLLGWEAGCNFPDQTPTYIDNLCRLGLAEVPASFYTIPGSYDQLENHPQVESVKKAIEADENFQPVFKRKILAVTEMGKQFLSVCVISHDQKGLPKKTVI
jgi:hypothetical protein